MNFLLLLPFLVSSITYTSHTPIAYAETMPVSTSTEPTDKEKIEQAVMDDCPIEERGTALYIIGAESQFNRKAVGDNGTSFGPVQIHLPAHPDISLSQAEDIDFSIKFLCDNLKNGKGSMWSTYPLASTSP